MIYPQPPSVGLVIGTYGSVPYIHLQLEALRRHDPEMPVLIMDDASPHASRLAALCERYGAEFRPRAVRQGHVPGDMLVFTDGLAWARDRGVELLVKFSRRWIPLIPWRTALQALALESQASTFSGRCLANGFGFRTEAMAMHTATWLATDALRPVREALARAAALPPEVFANQQGHFLVEAIVHRGAAIANAAACPEARAYEAKHPAKPGCGNYAEWPLLGESRRQVLPGVLWHNANRAELYHRALLQWGIDEYKAADFVDASANLRG